MHLRRMLATNEDLARKIEVLERKVGKHDADLQAILNVLQELLQPPAAAKRPMGFVGPGKKYWGSDRVMATCTGSRISAILHGAVEYNL